MTKTSDIGRPPAAAGEQPRLLGDVVPAPRRGGLAPGSGEQRHLRGDAARPGSSGRSLWLWVAAGFLFLTVLWVALFLGARAAHIESVPLVDRGAKP